MSNIRVINEHEPRPLHISAMQAIREDEEEEKRRLKEKRCARA